MRQLQCTAFQGWTRPVEERYPDQVPTLRHRQSFEAVRARTGKPESFDSENVVWLYVPKMTPAGLPESPSAPALEVWRSASISQNPDTELSVSSSGKPTRQPPSWPGWQTRHWITLLSGTMSAASTAARGVARFISSLADIPASLSPSQARGRGNPIPGISGRSSNASSARCGRNGASSRTSRGTLLLEPPASSQAFADWATASKQACFRRSKSVHPTFGAGSSFWPTPTRSLYCNRVSLELSQAGMKFRDCPLQTGSQVAIGKVARVWTLMWMIVRSCGTPTTDFSFRHSLPLHIDLQPGARYSTGDLTFNPNFSDWLMGWPIGWTAPTRPVTGWSAWLRQMRGELSRLPIVQAEVEVEGC